jgi:hypothetical protein
VKPGSGVNILTKFAKNEVMNLTKGNVVLLWVDANDMSKNNSEIGLSHIINFVKDNGHTNIVLLSVPHRYDLIKSFCVNKEITMSNRKLAKCIKIYEQCTLLNIYLNRGLFTNHGLHLNGLGKDVIYKQPVSHIYALL